MGTPNFTNYANVKSWLALTTDTDETLLVRMISDASRMILAYLQRAALFKTTYNDVYDGHGTTRLYLDQWPVLSVASLVANGQTIPVAPAPQTEWGYGYILELWNGACPGEPQALTFRGSVFRYGHSNIMATYAAGYSVVGEAQTVPATPYQITVNQPSGMWAQDDGVTYANGTALAAVTGTPSVGQYNAPTTTVGQYTFAAADAAQAVLISYSYIPFDIEQACIEIVAERYKYRGRIGQKTASQAGATTASYDTSGMTDAVKMRLRPYVRKSLL